MSTILRQAPSQVAAPATRQLAVAWAISREAVHRARPDLVAAAPGPVVMLEWRIRVDAQGRVAGDAALIDRGAATALLSIVPGSGCWREAGDGDHIDLPELLAVSRAGDGRIRYARSILPGCWGLPGGRYDLTAG